MCQQYCFKLRDRSKKGLLKFSTENPQNIGTNTACTNVNDGFFLLIPHRFNSPQLGGQVIELTVTTNQIAIQSNSDKRNT